jgi:hypothetical protein
MAAEMGYAMDGLPIFDIVLFTAGTFGAAFVTGLAGFAFGIVAAAIWLHVLSPAQTAPLIVAFALIVQGVSVWKLRRAVKLQRIWPFLLGSAIGVPLGAGLLRWAPATEIRMTVGALLIAFSLYNWFRPQWAFAARAGAAGDGAIGILNGVIGRDRTGRYRCGGLVQSARLAASRAAGRLSARRRRHVSDVCFVVRRYRHGRQGHCFAILDWIAGVGTRHLGQTEILRPTERGRIPPGRSGAAARVRRKPGVPRWLTDQN